MKRRNYVSLSKSDQSMNQCSRMIALALTEKSKKQEKQTFPIKMFFSFVAPMIGYVQTPLPSGFSLRGGGSVHRILPYSHDQRPV